MEEVPALPDDILELGRRIGPTAFVVGCARSGTSILGEALAAHPAVAYLFEASPLWNSVVPEKPDHRLVAADVSPEIAVRVYETLAAQKEELHGDILVEKNPKHVLRLPFLHALFPQARFLHLIRDGRDTLASLMFRNRGEQWGHLKVPGWKDLLERYREQNHIRCAHQWCRAVSSALADASVLPTEQYLELRYEQLVADPLPTLTRAFAFLNLEMDPAVTEFATRIQDVTRGSYHAKKQVRHYVENHERRIGRYRENLSPEELRDVEAVCGDLLRKLGYEASSETRQ
jgi:hypothetical protein